MSAHSHNETWILDAVEPLLQKVASDGLESLSPIERLIKCIWVADYGMRNAGDLDTAQELQEGFQSEAARLAGELDLKATLGAFALPKTELQGRYFELFDTICDEVKARTDFGW